MKKVSIIITFYNGKEWLKEAIDSVLSQTYSNIEVLLVNDGSKENITEIVTDYGDKIRYFLKENGGVSTARNLGIKESTGDYIAFMDSDDCWMPEKLEKQIAFMENQGILWSNTGYYNWFPDEDDRLELVDNSLSYDNIFMQTLVSLRIATPSVVVSRKCFEQIDGLEFPVEMRKGQDTAFYSTMSRHYPLGLIQEPLMKVRMRSDNSFKNAVARFHMKAQLCNHVDFTTVEVPFIVRSIYAFYRTFDWLFIDLFKVKISTKHQLFAKMLWALPYSLERYYAKRHFNANGRNENFILRYNS